eukprot:m.1057045 g.1057045  ORF g.1057045 m.1057045 type:complete len:636 (+) comp24204_c2_seq3:205-2112(+)
MATNHPKRCVMYDDDTDGELRQMQDKCGVFGCYVTGPSAQPSQTRPRSNTGASVDGDASVLDNESFRDCDNAGGGKSLKRTESTSSIASNDSISAMPVAASEFDVPGVIAMALQQLQHRGQESCGIVTCPAGGHEFSIHKGEGLVSSVFSPAALAPLAGKMGIGHVRYSTAGAKDLITCQPFVVHTADGPIALAHNGELVNQRILMNRIMQHGVGMATKSDSEIIIQMLCTPAPTPNTEHLHGPDWRLRFRTFMQLADTSYSLAFLTTNGLWAVRDPFGNRPLCIGKIDLADGGVCWVVSSESCPFVSIGATFVREVLPGEIVHINDSGVQSLDVVNRPASPEKMLTHRVSKGLPSNASGASSHHQRIRAVPRRASGPPPKHTSGGPAPRAQSGSSPPVPSGADVATTTHKNSEVALCIFEFIYFSRPDSYLNGQMVYSVRKSTGRQLHTEFPVDCDVVTCVPESATPAAMGFAEAAGVPFENVLNKNRYIGRSFILPSNHSRKLAVAKKFAPLVDNIRGKRVVIIDDSIVRGNTMPAIVYLLRKSGAAEVHIRIASPPIKFPCYMGINIPSSEELVANNYDLAGLRDLFGVDTIQYLSHDGLIEAVSRGTKDDNGDYGYCSACLTGEYPVELEW